VTDQVAAIGEPTVFPMLMLRSIPAVAKLIETLPEVQEIVRDTGGIEILGSGVS
jgi:hypothetical protein